LRHQPGQEREGAQEGLHQAADPGAAAGGCAFDGAKIALQPIVDVAHLVHGPIACEGNSWDNRHSASSGPQTYRTGYTTDINELDVIYGGEKRLFKAIREIIDKTDPPAIFVYQTCVTAMIGDDIEAVCKRASEKFGKPVIPVDAPGFAGPKNLGNKLGAEALLDHVIGTVEPDHHALRHQHHRRIQPVGRAVAGQAAAGRAGRARAVCISGDGRYNEVAGAHRARANMMVCSKSMINIATRMQQRWGIPVLRGQFYGISDMSTTLREIARLLVARAPADLIGRTEALIAPRKPAPGNASAPTAAPGRQEGAADHRRREELERGVGAAGGRARSGGHQRQEEHQGRQGQDQGDHGRRRAHDRRHDAARDVRDAARRRADIMLSGGRSQFVALKARMPWMDINQERHHAFAGYEGMVTMVAEIDKALFNPVWEQVRTPAPWETHDALLALEA
jgi:nitrogenase molybdenum-cofactor synthesis protein NifE